MIGKKLSILKKYLTEGSITVVVTDQLLEEIRIVTQRKKLKKYFSQKSVKELMRLLKIIAENVNIKPTHFISRDPKDNFLLDLIEYSKADFLVTGDTDLLELNPFKTAKIINPSDFESYLIKERK